MTLSDNYFIVIVSLKSTLIPKTNPMCSSSSTGKSIVVHGPNGGGERMACANIVEDKDIVKYATIR